MGSKPYIALTPEYFDKRPTSDSFGASSLDTVITIMQTELRDGVWVYVEEEIQAISRMEPRSARWIDIHGKDHTARWWNESVRCSLNSGIQAGDQVVVTLFPWSAAQIDLAIFASEVETADSQPGTEPLEEQLHRLRFKDEFHFWRWIQQTPAVPTTRTHELVARVPKPTPLQDLREELRQPSSANPPRLVYGLLPPFTSIDQIQADIQSLPSVQKALAQVESGSLKITHPNSGNTASKLFDETKRDSGLILSIAVQQAISGPIKKPENWYGKPISEFVIKRLGAGLNNINRREGRRIAHEMSGLQDSVNSSGDCDDRIAQRRRKKRDSLISIEKLRVNQVNESQSLIHLKAELAEINKKIADCEQAIQASRSKTTNQFTRR